MELLLVELDQARGREQIITHNLSAATRNGYANRNCPAIFFTLLARFPGLREMERPIAKAGDQDVNPATTGQLQLVGSPPASIISRPALTRLLADPQRFAGRTRRVDPDRFGERLQVRLRWQTEAVTCPQPTSSDRPTFRADRNNLNKPVGR